MTNAIYALVAVSVFGALMFWMGYRLGFNNGLATWRKDYRSMTTKDIKAHRAIIRQMETGQR
jgi:hypothetical protein